MYELLGICLALATFLGVNALASFGTTLAWRLLKRRARQWPARARGEILFAVRMAAPILALISVALFFIPAYVSYEPRSTKEVVSRKLAGFALLSALGVGLAVWRYARAFVATRALRRKWLMLAEEIQLPGINIPAFRISHSFPIIAVIGTMRPRLFIADQVLQSLSADELAAAIAHECGHLAARDNLKRGLLRACRDALMIIPCGRSLDRAWAVTAESAADEHAAQTSPDVALNLAAALIRIARMIPAGARPDVPLAAFLVGDETRGVKTRIRRLLEIASATGQAKQSPAAVRFVPILSLVLFLVAGTVLASNAQFLFAVHSLVEKFVFLLS